MSEALAPGWTGKRYILCTDGKWHSVSAVGEDYVDTLCCADVSLAKQRNNSKAPTCAECERLHWKLK